VKKISVFILLTLKQSVRDRFFLAVIFLAGFYILLSVFLALLSVGHHAYVLRRISLAGVELLSLLLLCVSITTSFSRERDTRIREVYLTSFSPALYLGGKLLGYILLAFFFLGFCLLACLPVLLFNQAFAFSFLTSFYYLWLKLSLVCGLALFFSVVCSSLFTALISILALYLAAEILPQALVIVTRFGSGFQKDLLELLSLILPRTDLLQSASGSGPEQAVIGFIYCALYLFILWLGSLLVIQKKEY